MAAERKTKLSKNLLRMKVWGRRGGGPGHRGTWDWRPGRGRGGGRAGPLGRPRRASRSDVHSFT